jgi:antitoxin CptB
MATSTRVHYTSDVRMEDVEYNRMKWQCRRGMLELDVLLGRYLESNWTIMDQDNKQALRRLLGFPDQMLQGWLCDGTDPDTEVAAIVRAIRAADNH